MACAGNAGDFEAVRGEPVPRVSAEAGRLLARGRDCFSRRAWRDAHSALTGADQLAPLSPRDLELLSTAAAMVGRDAEWASILERAYEGHLQQGAPLLAVRCAFWIGVRLVRAGEAGRAGGWLARARRLLDSEAQDCAELGYLLLPKVFQQEASGDLEGAAATAREAARFGERFGDRDLFALATHELGHVLVRDGRVAEGLANLDEAMLAVSGGALSPFVTGIVYCGTIAACHEVYELRRAGEWTAALSRWCDEQPELLAFTGTCLVHRAEILQIRGAWRDALDQANRATTRLLQGESPAAAGRAFYRVGELCRLKGDLLAAEEAYRAASRSGVEPQPGLALLRLAQGRPEVAATTIRRALAERAEPLARASLLPAYVEILLAVGAVEEARAACAELDQVAVGYESAMLAAMAAHARGAADLADGRPREALASLRRAAAVWQELDAPYEAACARVLVGVACRSLSDSDAASSEFHVARETFASLGAAPDLAWIDMLESAATADSPCGLTARELEVLRLVAAGLTNREIASRLVISQHTVARHVQNIFAKVGVSSRTAAGAFAFEHGLARPAGTGQD